MTYAVKNNRFIQWSQLVMRWECVACRGISFGRDYDTLYHVVDPDGKIAALRSKASTPTQQRLNGQNPLYHRAGCSQLVVIPDTCEENLAHS